MRQGDTLPPLLSYHHRHKREGSSFHSENTSKALEEKKQISCLECFTNNTHQSDLRAKNGESKVKKVTPQYKQLHLKLIFLRLQAFKKQP
jgi:hypothetical protein